MNAAEEYGKFHDVLGDVELSVVCPTCAAEVNEPCVYVWPKGVRECHFLDSDQCTRHNENQHARLALVGTPTKITHNTRKHLVFKRAIRDRRQAELAQLQQWLKSYGDLFAE